ncbi:MAG: phytanoyl-CoA dioxygenase family protein [Chitinophagales bacterium]|nr:phytanoyl-CoA dioxygenase family protein [Chitinophagales bacterium]
MTNSFKDKELNKHFEKEGYVLIDFLSKEAVADLQLFYTNNPFHPTNDFHSTHFLEDTSYKRKVHEAILQASQDKLAELLANYQAVFANFMVKEPGSKSIMPLHADWTYVNEEETQSIALWCPLVDTCLENGMLGVVPKSHLLEKNFRGPKIPSPFHDYNQYIIDTYGKLLEVKAGQAVIYNHRLLHFSPPNLSKEPRLAFNLVLVPKDAEIVHYAAFDSYPKVFKYTGLNSDFFINYVHFQIPDADFLDQEIQLDLKSFSKTYLDETLRSKKSWWQSLFA